MNEQTKTFLKTAKMSKYRFAKHRFPSFPLTGQLTGGLTGRLAGQLTGLQKMSGNKSYSGGRKETKKKAPKLLRLVVPPWSRFSSINSHDSEIFTLESWAF